jgi:hypothetical protein
MSRAGKGNSARSKLPRIRSGTEVNGVWWPSYLARSEQDRLLNSSFGQYAGE